MQDKSDIKYTSKQRSCLYSHTILGWLRVEPLLQSLGPTRALVVEESGEETLGRLLSSTCR